MIRNIPDVYHRWKSSSAYRPFFLTSRVLLVFIVAVSLASVTPFYRVLKSTTRAAHSQTSNPIQHIIILLKENRTFDSMFGTFPGANGATTYTDPNGVVYPLNHQPDHLGNQTICSTHLISTRHPYLLLYCKSDLVQLPIFIYHLKMIRIRDIY